MTRRRLLVLTLGMLGLLCLFIWRVALPVGPPKPDRLDRSEAKIETKSLPDLVSLSGNTMGTTYSVKFYSALPSIQEKAQARVDQTLEAVNSAMSTYDPASELSLLNRMDANVPFSASEQLFFVLSLSNNVHKLTRGAFDVTVGPLVGAYGFGAHAQQAVPDSGRLALLNQHVGMQHVTLDSGARTVTKGHQEVNIDLSAVAKGYGVDRVAMALESLEINNYIVEVGGEIRVKGTKANQQPWTLGIEFPDPTTRRIYMTLSLSPDGNALATSGDYRNYHKVGETLVSHTMDPRVGRPVPRRTASVSVIRPTAAEADALATALGVLLPDEAIELANTQDWQVLLLLHANDDAIVPRASRSFVLHHPLPN